ALLHENVLSEGCILSMQFAGRLLFGNAVWAGIDIKFFSSQEADQNLVALTREFNRQTRRGGYRRDNWKFACERLLHDLERSASADEKDMFAERKNAFQKSPAEDFINSIVSSHVFARDEKVSFKIKNGSSVQATGFFKSALRLPQLFRKRADDLSANRRRFF